MAGGGGGLVLPERQRRGKKHSKRKKKKRIGFHIDMTPMVDIVFSPVDLLYVHDDYGHATGNGDQCPKGSRGKCGSQPSQSFYALCTW